MDNLKKERLEQYKKQIFILRMDIVALQAIGETDKLKAAEKALDNVKKAYKAVEGMTDAND